MREEIKESPSKNIKPAIQNLKQSAQLNSILVGGGGVYFLGVCPSSIIFFILFFDLY
jgi:hypothetical protein